MHDQSARSSGKSNVPTRATASAGSQGPDLCSSLQVRDRIRELRRVPARDLIPNPKLHAYTVGGRGIDLAVDCDLTRTVGKGVTRRLLRGLSRSPCSRGDPFSRLECAALGVQHRLILARKDHVRDCRGQGEHFARSRPKATGPDAF
jgi:hypothetical protein